MTKIPPNKGYFSSYQKSENYVVRTSPSKGVDSTIIAALETEILFGTFEKIDTRIGAVITAFGKISIPLDQFQIGQNLLAVKTNENLITILTIPNPDFSQAEILEILETRDYGRYGDFMQINTTPQAELNEASTSESHLVTNISEILNNNFKTNVINHLTTLNAQNALNQLISLATEIYCSRATGSTEEEMNLFSHLRSIATATASLNWQVFLLPFNDEGKINFIYGFKRRKSKNPILDFENFIFEGSNNTLGKFSLNFLYSRNLSIFELVLKYTGDSAENLVEEIKKSFLENSYYFNMQAKFSVKKHMQTNKSGMLGEVLQEYCKNKAFTVLA